MQSEFLKEIQWSNDLFITSVNLFKWSGGPKWTRFSAEKPRRLQQSTGLLPRAGFRAHFLNSFLPLLFALVLWLTLCLKWWAKMDSNHRPHDYQSCALASWAIGPYRHFVWWRVPGSNRWPPACKAGALPAELTPHIVEIKTHSVGLLICSFGIYFIRYIFSCAL